GGGQQSQGRPGNERLVRGRRTDPAPSLVVNAPSPAQFSQRTTPTGRARRRAGVSRRSGVRVAATALRKKEHDVDAQRFDIPTGPPPPVPTFDAAADAFIAHRKAPDADGKPMRRSWRYDK